MLWGLKPLLNMPHKMFERGDLDDKMWGLIAEFRDREGIESPSMLWRASGRSWPKSTIQAATNGTGTTRRPFSRR